MNAVSNVTAGGPNESIRQVIKGVPMKSLLVYPLIVSFFLAGIPGSSQAMTADEAYQAGAELYKNGKWDQSIDRFQEAVQLNPQHWLAYQGMGYAYFNQGNNHAALNACTISLRINPGNRSLQEFMRAKFNYETTPSQPSDVGSAGAVAVSILAGVVVLVASLFGNVHIPFGGGSC